MCYNQTKFVKNELYMERFHGNGLKNLNSVVILKIIPPKKNFGARGWHKESFLKIWAQCEAQWPIGYGVGLRIKRSSVRIRPWPLRWVLKLGQGSLLPLSQGEAFTLASISYLAILVKYILAKKKNWTRNRFFKIKQNLGKKFLNALYREYVWALFHTETGPYEAATDSTESIGFAPKK